jgi:hypothetical protein
MGENHGCAKAVNAAAASINGLATGLELLRQAPDPLHTFWTPPSPLSKSVAAERGQQKWNPVLCPTTL